MSGAGKPLYVIIPCSTQWLRSTRCWLSEALRFIFAEPSGSCFSHCKKERVSRNLAIDINFKPAPVRLDLSQPVSCAATCDARDDFRKFRSQVFVDHLLIGRAERESP